MHLVFKQLKKITMTTSSQKCVICGTGSSFTLKLPQSKKNDYHSTSISKWKLLTAESLCMLFGLPVNHEITTMFTGQHDGVNGKEEPVLCNKCIQDTSDVHFIFWQLHNLEMKLTKLQWLIFERLKLNWGTSDKEDDYSEDPQSKLLQSWFKDIKSESEHWPKPVYISKWKDAVETANSLILNDSSNIKIKTEPDHHTLSSENPEDFNEDNFEYDYDATDPLHRGNDNPIQYPKKRKKQNSRVLHHYSMDSNGRYLCTEDPSICNRTYVTKQLLTGHIKEFHTGRVHICNQYDCVEKFKSEITLLRHKRSVHGILVETTVKPISCLIIKEKLQGKGVHKAIFKSKGSLSCHKRNVHSELIKVCDICGQTVSSRNMQTHYNVKHLGRGRFKCEFCTMDFSDSDQFKAHENLHNQLSQTMPFTCVASGCTEILANSYDLKKHVNKNHLLSGLKCEICGIMKHNQYLLNRHLKIHKGQMSGNCNPVICDVCGKSYVSELSLKVHKTAFHMGKRFPCDICDKVFKRSNHLTRHKRDHSDEKPFKCSVCSKGFRSQENLKKHEEIHAGRKMYECQLCGKGFRQRQNLKQHLKTQQHRSKIS